MILLSLLTGILELGMCPPGLADVCHTANYLLFRSFFFLPPTLHSHRLLSTISIPCLILSDVARNVKSSFPLVGFHFQLQSTSWSEPVPARTADTPGWLRPAVTNMVSRYHSSACLSPTLSFQHTGERSKAANLTADASQALVEFPYIAVGRRKSIP